MVDIFIAEAPANLRIIPDPDEVDQVRWTAFDALVEEVAAQPTRFTPWLRIYLDKHAESTFGPRVTA